MDVLFQGEGAGWAFSGERKKAASGLLGIFCLCVTWNTRWVHQKPNSLKILGMPLPEKAKISVTRNDQLLLPLHPDQDGGSYTHTVPFLLTRQTSTVVTKD